MAGCAPEKKIWLRLAGLADHLDGNNIESAMLVVGFGHVSGRGGVFGLFLHVMEGRVLDLAFDGDGVADVISQSDLSGLEVPSAAIVAIKDELIGTGALGKTAGNGAVFRLGFAGAGGVLSESGG